MKKNILYHLSLNLFCTKYVTPKGLDKEEKEEKTGRFVRRERYVGSMSRSFYVGEDIRQEDIHAKYESGVLRLSIPKQEEKKAQIEDKKYIAIEG